MRVGSIGVINKESGSVGLMLDKVRYIWRRVDFLDIEVYKVDNVKGDQGGHPGQGSLARSLLTGRVFASEQVTKDQPPHGAADHS